jgi:hypothetical protein
MLKSFPQARHSKLVPSSEIAEQISGWLVQLDFIEIEGL